MDAPILFLARGHSGTSLLARILEKNGVFMGNQAALNDTYDSLPWTYIFQRAILPKFWKYGEGVSVPQGVLMASVSKCHQLHMRGWKRGPWGIKTCAGMFSHPMYKQVFPKAKYIHLIRDGRDVIMSGNGYFHMTNESSREQDWEYFKIITFGISNDLDQPPWTQVPEKPSADDWVMKSRFLIQAKSWVEHAQMMRHLTENKQLSPNVFNMRYEHLVTNPHDELERLFDWIGMPYTDRCRRWVIKKVHSRSVGKWRSGDLPGSVTAYLDGELRRQLYV